MEADRTPDPGARPVLHILCGLPCTGKTTLGLTLEAEQGAVRLCPDAWMARIVGHGRDDRARAGIEAVQLELAGQLLRRGLDVVLESGFWSRAERDAARAVAVQARAEARLHFLDAPIEELERRAGLRNAALPPDSFRIEPGELALWSTMIERPTPDELALS